MRFSEAIRKWSGESHIFIDCDLCGTYTGCVDTDGFKDIEKDLVRDLTDRGWIVLDYWYALCPFCHDLVKIWIK